MRLPWLAVLAFALAGCAATPDPTPAPAADAEAEQPPAWQHFEQSYDLEQTEVAIQGGHNSSGGNCVMLDDDALVTGTATVTWTPDPTTPEMELVLLGPEDLRSSTGDGQAVLELKDFQVGGRQPGSPLAWQVSDGAPVGAVVGLKATLTLSLDALTPDGDEFTPDGNWGCAVGH